jgi:type II secretory pathway pseudopilin PulG
MLVTLMFFIAMLAITAAIAAPLISFRIRRDREEEMIHRGVQYSRAVRRYFRKFGRFPNRIEDLESANNMRFLRKRYKDPITGQDFKPLHLGEVKLNFGPGIIGASNPGVPVAGGAGAQNAAAATVAAVALANTQTSTNLNPTQSGDNSSNSAQGSGQGNSAGTSSSGTTSSFGSPSGQVFGGGPIVGVVSTSQAETIREFNKKNHYNDWQFIYDPGSDRGGLLNTPAQPPLQNAVGPGLGAGSGNQAPPNMQGAPGVPLPQPPQPPPPNQ